jgi:AraC family transcriptional regulator
VTPCPKQFTHGQVRRWRRVGGLVLAEVEYQPGQRLHRLQHAHARFMLVLRGSLVEQRADDNATHGPSSLLFRPGQEPHSYVVSDAGALCLVVDMDEAWLARAGQHAPVLSRSAEFRGGLLVHLAQRLHGEFQLRDEVSRLAIESLVLGLLAEASRRAAKAHAAGAPVWLLKARAFVDAHFAERLTIAAVALLVGVHPVHLARTFRRVYDTTFSGYVRDVRVAFACRELAGSAAPLSAIAAAAGFCDQSHFTRVFKRYTGQSPAEYRLAAARRSG